MADFTLRDDFPELGAAGRDSCIELLKVVSEVTAHLIANGVRAGTEHVVTNTVEMSSMELNLAFHHQGLGLVLIKLAEKIAKEKEKDNMWLGVWEKNYQAQAFYEKDGFKRVSQHTFVVGEDSQTDLILVKRLK